MRFFLTVLILNVGLIAQQNNNLPTLVIGTTFDDPRVIGTGHLVTGCYIVESGSACPLSFTVTETSGILPSITMKPAICRDNALPNGFDTTLVVMPFYGVSASNGTPVFSISPTPPRLAYINYGEYTQGTNLAFDVAGTFSGNSPTNPSVSVTTTAQNDLISSCMATGDSPQASFFTNDPIASNQQFQSVTPGTFSDLGAMGSWYHAGLLGSTTSSYVGSGGNNGTGRDGWIISTLGFKASTLTIGTTKLAHCSNGLLCYEKLRGYGGTGTYVWSLASGSWPSGCSGASLTTDGNGNGIVSCTPTVAQTTSFNLTFQLTDGTSTTTALLPLTVGTGLQAINFRNICTFSGIGVGPCGTTYLTGDVIHILYFGDDTHGFQGVTLSTTDLGDGCGDTFKRAEASVGIWPGALVDYYTTATCGSSTITYSGRGYDPLSGATIICTGCQEPMDDIVGVNGSPGAVTSSNLSASIITNVPNVRVLAVASLNCSSTCTTSTTTAGFTSVASISTLAWFTVYKNDEASPGTYSVTNNYTNSSGMGNTPLMMTLIPIRPEISGLTPSLGENRHSRMN